MAETDNPVNIQKPNPDAKLRVFCFTGTLGGASAFDGWSDWMPSGVEICAMQYPGRENMNHMKPINRMVKLAQFLAGHVENYIDKPYMMLGWSLGAQVAFEVARELFTRHAKAPRKMIITAVRSPSVQFPDSQLAKFSRDEVLQLIKDNVPEHVAADSDAMDAIEPLFREDFKISETYVFAEGEPLPTDFSVISAEEDNIVPRNESEAWKELSSKPENFKLIDMPGNHFSVFTLEGTRKLFAEEVKQVVDSL